MADKRCPECGQPVLRRGQERKHPDQYRHASGCPLDDMPSEPTVDDKPAPTQSPRPETYGDG